MKKFIIALAIILVVGVVAVVIYMNRTEPSVALKNYFDKLNSKDYEGMYDYVITDTTKEDFVTRVKNIYEGIEASNISATVLTNTRNEEDNSITNVTFNNSMDTVAGNMNFMNTVKVKKVDGEYKIIWDSSVIFSDLKDNYKVRVTALESTRGAIYDRNGIALAKDGEINTVGLVPGKMNETTDKAKLAELLGITEETINNELSASYVKEDTFVPLRKISKDEQELKNELLKIARICSKALDDAPYYKILVLDGTQGSSALNQAKVFHEMLDIDGVIVTKLDGTSKGGAILSIVHTLRLPIIALGVGEGMEDLQSFDENSFIQGFLDSIFEVGAK